MPLNRARTPKQHSGYTLTELAVVILGTLVIVSASLLYLDKLIRTTNQHMLLGMKGTVESVVLLAHMKARTENVSSGSRNINGHNILFHDGYPQANWDQSFRHLLKRPISSSAEMDHQCNEYPLCGIGNQKHMPGIGRLSSGRAVMIWPSGYRLDKRCYMYYYHPENGNRPITGLILDGC